jgi:hypothetical protein
VLVVGMLGEDDVVMARLWDSDYRETIWLVCFCLIRELTYGEMSSTSDSLQTRRGRATRRSFRFKE